MPGRPHRLSRPTPTPISTCGSNTSTPTKASRRSSSSRTRAPTTSQVQTSLRRATRLQGRVPGRRAASWTRGRTSGPRRTTVWLPETSPPPPPGRPRIATRPNGGRSTTTSSRSRSIPDYVVYMVLILSDAASDKNATQFATIQQHTLQALAAGELLFPNANQILSEIPPRTGFVTVDMENERKALNAWMECLAVGRGWNHPHRGSAERRPGSRADAAPEHDRRHPLDAGGCRSRGDADEPAGFGAVVIALRGPGNCSCEHSAGASAGS